MSIETERQILKLPENKEFAKEEPILWMALLKSCPHTYTIEYKFNSIKEAKEILKLETDLHRTNTQERTS